MLGLRLFVVLIVAVGSAELAGCGGEAAGSDQTTRARASSTAAGPGKDAGRDLLTGRRSRPLHKDASREMFLSTYHNPEAGISFRYPRNYSLEEGDVQERSFFLKKQDDFDIEQPGATLLATVLIPEDGYPNTTFEHGSLQFVVNEAGTEQGCREASLVADNGSGPRTMTIQGIAFKWSEQESETAGTKVLERSYGGYSRGTCYEFLLTVAAEETPDLDGFKKPADIAKIMKQMEKIVSSVQIFTKSVTRPAESSEESTDRL